MAQTVRFQASLIDGVNQRASVVVHAVEPDAATAAQIASDANAWAALLQAITKAQILHVSADIVATATPGSVPSGHADSRVTEVAGFTYTATGTPYRYGNYVNAFDDALLNSAGIPDSTQAAVLAYENGLLAALQTSGFYTNPDGQKLLAFSSTFRGSRRRKRSARGS
jgi:hypothetical protein